MHKAGPLRPAAEGPFAVQDNGALPLWRLRGGGWSGESSDPIISRFFQHLPLARRRTRPAGPDFGGEEGDRDRTGFIRHARPQSRAMDETRRPRAYARGSAQGGLEGIIQAYLLR